MHFPFHIAKATEVAAAFLQHAGGQINIMKLVKLVYLLDRTSLDRRRIPVVGGQYVSMRNGPLTSELLDLINAGSLSREGDTSWMDYIEDRQDHHVRLRSEPERLYVSDAETQLIREVWETYGDKDQWELRDFCHEHCREWTRRSSGVSDIDLEALGLALGKTAADIRVMREEAAAQEFLEAALA